MSMVVYGSKSKYSRKYARTSRVKRLAKGKTSSVQQLARSIQSIKRKMKADHNYLNYVQGSTQSNLSSDYLAVNLCSFNTMTAMFGSSADDETDNKIVHQSFGFDGYISLENLINNEEETINMTVFLVSLKDQVGGAFNPVTGALTLTQSVHYYSQDGLTMLNKKIFNIHKCKRINLTNHGTALSGPSAQTKAGTDWRFYWRHSPRQSIQNPIGNWKSLGSGVDPSKSFYFLAFNNNSVLDGESPCITFNCVHTMKTVA